MRLQKYLWFSIILFIVTTGLTGCGLGFGAAPPTTEALQPLNPTDWPTPVPTMPPAVSTPFPMVTLVPTPTSTLSPTLTPISLPSAGGNTNKQLEYVNAASAGLSPVTVALVTSNNVTIRRGPGESYAAVGIVQAGEMAAVFGKNQAGNWLYVLTVSEFQGWLPTGTAQVLGSLDQAPVLPPNPLASPATAPIPAGSSNAATVVGNNMLPALADLKAVAKARVNSAGLNVRQGPGVSYNRLGALTGNDEVSVLALNSPKDWALIEMANGQRGWVALPYLTIEQGSLAEVPVVRSSILNQAQTANQPTPTMPVIESATSAGSSLSPAATPASQSSTITNKLVPLATAHINQSEIAVRPEPSTASAPIDTLTDDQEQINVLALDSSQRWALVEPAFSHTGWVSLSDLTVQESLANAPQVITAWVDSNAIEVRRGPGIYYDVVGSLTINSLLSILGLDETQSWALVTPIMGGGFGWTPIQFLTFSEPLADIPLALAPPLEAQLASISQPTGAVSLPTRPVRQSKIVFQLSSGGDIMVINPDGSGLRRLTHGIDPVLSPDGQRAAFTRWEGETGSLWLINVDGTHERSLLGFTKQAKGPAWSPDGSQIVLNYQHEGRLDAKKDCVNLAKNPNPRPPRNAYDFDVQIKDNRPYLCWTIPPDPHWSLRVINVTDGSFKDLYGGQYAFRPTWDPTQSWRIVDDAGNGLLETDVNRDYHQNITDQIEDGSPVFSPDGRYLAVADGQQGGDQGYDIYRLNRDGSGRVRLTQTPLWVPVVPGDFKQWNNVSPAWSPDGSQIAFLTDRTGRWEIWVMNEDGSEQHPMFSDAIDNQLNFTYHFVDERMLSWR